MTKKESLYESTFAEACSVGRKAPRFVRNDIKTSISKYRLFNSGQHLQVKLIDISSGGVQISTFQKLKPNTKLCVSFEFSDGKKFYLDSTIVRRDEKAHKFYDLAFESENLAEICKDARLTKLQLFDGNEQVQAKFRSLTYDTVQITTPAKLDSYSPLFIVFHFNSGEELKTYARIIRSGITTTYQYGIKFDKRNDELGDHLLATQTDLFFG